LGSKQFKTTLEKDATAFTNDRQNIKSLSKIVTGKQLIDIISQADSFHFDHDELKNVEEATLIGGLFEDLRDYGDIGPDRSYIDVAKLEIQLNEEIVTLQKMGILLYGVVRNLRLRKDEEVKAINFNTATVTAVRQDNPFIVGEFLIVKFSNKINFS
jgi:hypothetical protein